MKIEKLEDGYRLTDLYITASILCAPNMELINVEPDKNKKQTMFVVKGDPVKIKEIIDAFFNGKHMVDANMYKSKLQTLKSRLYANF
jgi:glutamate formiminotransferase